MSNPVEHVRVSGAGIYENEIICACGLVVLDWEAHCRPPEATPAHQDADLMSPDPRESSIGFEGQP